MFRCFIMFLMDIFYFNLPGFFIHRWKVHPFSLCHTLKHHGLSHSCAPNRPLGCGSEIEKETTARRSISNRDWNYSFLKHQCKKKRFSFCFKSLKLLPSYYHYPLFNAHTPMLAHIAVIFSICARVKRHGLQTTLSLHFLWLQYCQTMQHKILSVIWVCLYPRALQQYGRGWSFGSWWCITV